jgi:hypothetical protein
MKKFALSICFVFFAMTALLAQKAAKSVFVELGGPGLASVNYDMRLQKKEDGLGFRVGIGGFSVKDEFLGETSKTGLLTVPVALNYLIGKDKKNYFEIGAGFTYVNLTEKSDNFEDDQFSTSFGHLHFGYRLQPEKGGFTFRAGITPVFNSNGFIPYYASLSFGYKF